MTGAFFSMLTNIANHFVSVNVIISTVDGKITEKVYQSKLWSQSSVSVFYPFKDFRMTSQMQIVALVKLSWCACLWFIGDIRRNDCFLCNVSAKFLEVHSWWSSVCTTPRVGDVILGSIRGAVEVQRAPPISCLLHSPNIKHMGNSMERIE